MFSICRKDKAKIIELILCPAAMPGFLVGWSKQIVLPAVLAETISDSEFLSVFIFLSVIIISDMIELF